MVVSSRVASFILGPGKELARVCLNGEWRYSATGNILNVIGSGKVLDRIWGIMHSFYGSWQRYLYIRAAINNPLIS